MDLNIVNAVDHPAMVVQDHILALPTLVKHSPDPLRQLVGNLTDAKRVRSALDLAPEDPAPKDPAPKDPAPPSLTEGGSFR